MQICDHAANCARNRLLAVAHKRWCSNQLQAVAIVRFSKWLPHKSIRLE